MSLETVQFIRQHGLAELCGRYKVTARRHGIYPNLVQLKYSQIESPMGERIVQECRGLILNELNDWGVVAYPYNKFFNHGEGHAAPIDWATARVYEKLDGSLMTLYPYDGQWLVASSGLPDASGPVNGAYSGTFADLFWQTWKGLGYSVPRVAAGTCFMFELMTPHNRVVCRQSSPRIVLHGCRNLNTFEEIPPGVPASIYGWECVRSFPLTSLDECLTAACAIDPMDGEGYVVCDRDFRRVKVKSPQYVALAHLKEGFSGRRMLEIVRANESEEFLAHFPEYRDLYERIRTAYDELCATADFAFASLKDIPDRKSFAMGATRTPFSAALFAMRDGKSATAREFFAGCTIQKLEQVLGVDLNEAPAVVEASK